MILIDKNTRDGNRQIPIIIGSKFNFILENGISINGKISNIIVENNVEDNMYGLGGAPIHITNQGKRIWTIEVEEDL